MIDNAEQSLSAFYNSVGWETEGETTEDAKKWEHLRECAKDYASKSRLRVLGHMPPADENIHRHGLGANPVQGIFGVFEKLQKAVLHPSIFSSSGKASAAREKATERIGDHGVFLHG
jgi:hypothetical protein